jgi:threonine aldolase
VETAINPPDFYHSPRTSLVCIENTTNKGGGACWDFAELRKIREVCDQHGLKYHLDGARIWNALAAREETPEEYGELFDTISVCLSKGLGCPVGSLLVGSKADMEHALRIRKILGGGMRQAGYLAAAGLHALEHHRNRLSEDHRRAAEIGKLLSTKPYVTYVAPVETNIVIFELDPSITTDTEMVKALNAKGIRLIGMGQGKLRLVTHMDYTEDMHQYTLAVIDGLGLG